MIPLNMKFKWWQTGVIYQIYPRSFMDANGDGIGDLQGVINRLDYLAHTLGVDAIWLSPFYPSPMVDFGYDVSNYVDVDPMFGDLAIFDELLNKAHALNLKVIIDFVPNHCSDQHPWFLESRQSKDNPKRDWFIWKDAKPDGSPPNNWLSVFGGSAWEWDEHTQQYYLHKFVKEQADFNWRNPEVKAAMFEVIRFWLNRKVDGFRIDVAHFILKDPDFRDNPLNENGETPLHKDFKDYDSQIHIHDKGHQDVHEVYADLRTMLDNFDEKEKVSIGEIHVFDFDLLSSYYGSVERKEFHLPFNFTLLGLPWDATKARHLVESYEASLPKNAWPNYVMGNHDEKRMASRFEKDELRAMSLMLLTLRGTPTLYYGDEIGMLEAEIPLDKMQDPWGINVPGLGRDGCRTPMQWTNAKHAGFSEGASTWLPVFDEQNINVKDQLEEEDSLLNLYRKLLKIRRSSDALKCGAFETLNAYTNDQFWFYRRFVDQEECWILINFSKEKKKINLPSFAQILCRTQSDDMSKEAIQSLTLEAKEAILLAKNPMT